MKPYLPVIGLEVHVELRTKSKMFCGCPADHFGKTPNTQTCPVCLGLPGALPVPNKQAIDWTLMIGKALKCHLNLSSKFDRKHYFYPDLPKGYQISQYDEPLCSSGEIITPSGKIRITRVHLEEDTGKLQHTKIEGQNMSLVDFNRSGVPLVEIVTEPDLVSGKHAKEYSQKLQSIIRYLGVSDCDMEKGSMRLEANISLKTPTQKDLPSYKVEVKNLNSFRFLEKAIDYEIFRQSELLEKGITPAQETRGFSESKNATFSQRSKETSEDYRYFPEPDIPPIVFTQVDIDQILKAMPLLPDYYQDLFINRYKLRADYAAQLTLNPEVAHFLESILNQTNLEPASVASYLINKKVSPKTTSVDQVIKHLNDVEAKPIADSGKLDFWIKTSLEENPDLVKKYQNGKTAVLGVFMGDIRKRSQNQASPKEILPRLLKLLG